MELTRRDVGALCVGAVATAALAGKAVPAFASQDNGYEAAIQEFTGGAETTEGGVTIVAPEIAENGNTVPVEISAAGASAIMLVAPGNPNAGVVTFEFSALTGERAASTRIRLAETQDVIVVARMEDGTFAKATRQIKVTIGGCGG